MLTCTVVVEVMLVEESVPVTVTVYAPPGVEPIEVTVRVAVCGKNDPLRVTEVGDTPQVGLLEPDGLTEQVKPTVPEYCPSPMGTTVIVVEFPVVAPAPNARLAGLAVRPKLLAPAAEPVTMACTFAV